MKDLCKMDEDERNELACVILRASTLSDGGSWWDARHAHAVLRFWCWDDTVAPHVHSLDRVN